MLTQLPGFRDPVHQAQHTFRVLLDCLAHPGTLGAIEVDLEAPEELALACAATCLTLLDLETLVWLQPSLSETARRWLQFHTGCRLTADPQRAKFALVVEAATCPPLASFALGTPDYPEDATTVLLQLPSLTAGESVSLRGPGIRDRQVISPALPQGFWPQWQGNQRHYPLGVDVFCLASTQVMALPRSSIME
ncbi:phosphonate C-P lyase system protein PhnH [Nodosilinea sp. LEGE 07088]|uniref:phosphonate C-P lyase system protein PhnH n=1 Tax=Nodosilinea sp. LEGE 07088 TaxID=2777968 RepID=UPI00187F8C43|nr:phosphonate C-P lyase system protein PhnH [Nodosilinea sp. LEGE 07088]MBE9139935.1 phosphonate C-P lyase system protein PhnH [Nodosilinea sp. LEGE 07088]